ncbi:MULTISPECIES: DUF998 domain-containing protein [Kordiimonas]|uniref:DUF998 domain-containing protein n=1 Tax=Kordiimonas TaxID=288021 RepID=UPI00257F77E9|nr:DUF998 domain-containing protein [Kordiimonas sp. UBA4487]
MANSDGLILHYMSMRRAIGRLGLLFPIILVVGSILFGDMANLGGDIMRLSISQYYHSPMGDVFVGVLCAEAIFLYAYQGYKDTPEQAARRPWYYISDNAAGNIAAVAAAGTAIFPTLETKDVLAGIPFGISSYLHWFFSLLFFLILAYFCLCLFTKSSDAEPTLQKRRRNKIYRLCGWTMLSMIGLGAVYLILGKYILSTEQIAAIEAYSPTFWLETISVWAFGLSWYVKGEAILKDMPYEEEEAEAEPAG